jgi:nucleoside-diphosphate-sugar epimerase
MNILITGINGFVGSNLVNALKEEHTIYGLDLGQAAREGVEKTFSWAELHSGTLPEVDVVVHLAGKAHDTKNQAMAQEYFEINTGLTRTIYDYFLASGATKFIFFSSVKAAADQVNGAVLTEDVVPAPKGPYGESKLLAEQYLREHWPHRGLGKWVYILRPCMIHGPGNKGNLNLLYQLASKGFPWPLGAFENRRSFTSVGNLCFILNGLINQTVASGTYHISDDEALSTNSLIKLMGQVMGTKTRLWRLPVWMVQSAAWLGGILQLPLNPERLAKLTENYVVDNTKIKQALGIDHLPVSTEAGLRKTLESLP